MIVWYYHNNNTILSYIHTITTFEVESDLWPHPYGYPKSCGVPVLCGKIAVVDESERITHA